MRRRSPLETLKDLRKRAHDRQESQLAAQVRAQTAAAALEEGARSRLVTAQVQGQSARQDENQRLGQQGITAAEGQRRSAWETALRRDQERLATELDHASESRRAAALEQERAQSALHRADAELRQVQGRLDERERARRLELERAQQDALDESATRRFLERSEA